MCSFLCVNYTSIEPLKANRNRKHRKGQAKPAGGEEGWEWGGRGEKEGGGGGRARGGGGGEGGRKELN